MRWISLAGCLILSACASSVTPQTPAQALYATEGYLTAAIQVSTTYASLPRCPQASLCSEQSVVDQMKAAASTATASVLSAQTLLSSSNTTTSQAEASVAAAQQAVSDLTAITSKVKP